MALPIRTLRRFQEEIRKIHALGDESFRELVSALEDMLLTVSTDALSSALDPEISTISHNDIEEVVDSLLSLCTLRDQLDSSTSELAEGIIRAVEVGGEDHQRLKERFISLLDLDQLNIIAKSGILLINHQRLFRDAQVLTDVRPAFLSNPKDPPEAAIITHSLKITYLENGEFKDFFVAMDVSGVDTLLNQLKRANLKAESLKSVLADTSVRYIDAEEKHRGREDGANGR